MHSRWCWKFDCLVVEHSRELCNQNDNIVMWPPVSNAVFMECVKQIGICCQFSRCVIKRKMTILIPDNLWTSIDGLINWYRDNQPSRYSVCRNHKIHEPELARLRQLTSVYLVNNMLEYWQARKLCHTSWKIEWSQQLKRCCILKLLKCPDRASSPFQVISQNEKLCANH